MKPTKHKAHPNHERWLVSYADFITLMFAFFVVMYATSKADMKKQVQMANPSTPPFAPSGSSSRIPPGTRPAGLAHNQEAPVPL